MKKDCAKFMKWIKHKGNSISCVCYESNMVDVNHNTSLQSIFRIPCRVVKPEEANGK